MAVSGLTRVVGYHRIINTCRCLLVTLGNLGSIRIHQPMIHPMLFAVSTIDTNTQAPSTVLNHQCSTTLVMDALWCTQSS